MTDEELKRLLDANAAENRHYFEIAAEATTHAIGLVAEKVTAVDERLTREAADIREEMRRRFSETQAMIKFSRGAGPSRAYA